MEQAFGDADTHLQQLHGMGSSDELALASDMISLLFLLSARLYRWALSAFVCAY